MAAIRIYLSYGQNVVKELIYVLLIEDDAAAAHLTLEALRDAQIANRVDLMMDGEEALKYLRQEPPYEGAPRPHLILLDLNLPKIDGREVLAAMKADPALRTIPVVVVTVSANPDDVEYAYRNQAAGYIHKQADVDHYFTAIRSLKELWFKWISFPKTGHNSATFG